MLLRQVHSAHSMPRVVSTVRVGTEQGVQSMPCIGETRTTLSRARGRRALSLRRGIKKDLNYRQFRDSCPRYALHAHTMHTPPHLVI